MALLRKFNKTEKLIREAKAAGVAARDAARLNQEAKDADAYRLWQAEQLLASCRAAEKSEKDEIETVEVVPTVNRSRFYTLI
jgi:hypothetical protein